MSNAPSAARLRHAEAIDPPRVDSRAFRQGWTVRTRLDGLLDDGRITPGEWQAAVEYRAAHDALTSAGHGPGSRPVGSARDARLDRIARIRSAESAIGPEKARLCHACAVEDQSWRQIGAWLGVRDVTAMGRAAEALRALAPAWRDAWKGRQPRGLTDE